MAQTPNECDGLVVRWWRLAWDRLVTSIYSCGMLAPPRASLACTVMQAANALNCSQQLSSAHWSLGVYNLHPTFFSHVSIDVDVKVYSSKK